MNKAKDGATGLINILRRTFATTASQTSSHQMAGQNLSPIILLRTWGIVVFPHSNCRAEIGVKTIKRSITGNVASSDDLDIDTFQQAILQYRNTPDPATKLSPALRQTWQISSSPHMEGHATPKRSGIKTPTHDTPGKMERTHKTPSTSTYR